MSVSRPTLFASSLLLSVSALPIQAETAWIQGMPAPLRSSAEAGEILELLSHGGRVEVIQRKGPHAQIRSAAGIQGWVRIADLTQTNNSTAGLSAQIEALQQEAAQREVETNRLREDLRSKQQQTRATEAELIEVHATRKRIKEEFDQLTSDAKNTVGLRAQIEELQGRLLAREREIQTLQQEIQMIEDRSGRDWFLIGALVILIGVGAGLLIGRMGSGGRKSTSENW